MREKQRAKHLCHSSIKSGVQRKGDNREGQEGVTWKGDQAEALLRGSWKHKAGLVRMLEDKAERRESWWPHH